jgi:hypothetical protein
MHLKVTFGNELLQTRVSPLQGASDSSHADATLNDDAGAFQYTGERVVRAV